MRRIIWGGAILGAAFLLSVLATRRYNRYEVTGESMAPTLEAGDYLVVDAHAYRRRPPRTGDIVVAPDPRDSARQLVKRVARINPAGQLWLEGDAAHASTDSRTFGWIPLADVQGRVRLRYYRRLSRF